MAYSSRWRTRTEQSRLTRSLFELFLNVCPTLICSSYDTVSASSRVFSIQLSSALYNSICQVSIAVSTSSRVFSIQLSSTLYSSICQFSIGRLIASQWKCPGEFRFRHWSATITSRTQASFCAMAPTHIQQPTNWLAVTKTPGRKRQQAETEEAAQLYTVYRAYNATRDQTNQTTTLCAFETVSALWAIHPAVDKSRCSHLELVF